MFYYNKFTYVILDYGNIIQTTGSLKILKKTNFHANSSIKLKPGFKVPEGKEFSANIQDVCYIGDGQSYFLKTEKQPQDHSAEINIYPIILRHQIV